MPIAALHSDKMLLVAGPVRQPRNGCSWSMTCQPWPIWTAPVDDNESQPARLFLMRVLCGPKHPDKELTIRRATEGVGDAAWFEHWRMDRFRESEQ